MCICEQPSPVAVAGAYVLVRVGTQEGWNGARERDREYLWLESACTSPAFSSHVHSVALFFFKHEAGPRRGELIVRQEERRITTLFVRCRRLTKLSKCFY